MNDGILRFLEFLGTFVIGGGLSVLITIKSVKTKASAEAMSSVQDVYQDLIRDLRDDRDRQRAYFEEQLSRLESQISSMKKDIESLKKIKCYDLSCDHRKHHH